MTESELAEMLRRNPDLQVDGELNYSRNSSSCQASTSAQYELAQASIVSEYTLQDAVILECQLRAIHDDRWGDIYAIPNGQYRNGQRMEPGLKAGVPDLFLPVPSGPYHGMYIELKWKDNKPKRDQLEWIRRLRQRGYHCVVIWDELAKVIEAIEDYLEG